MIKLLQSFLKILVHFLFLLLLSVIGLIGYAFFPDTYKPWTPINLNEEINFLTPYKISRLKNNYARCQYVLKAAEVEFTSIPDRQAGECRLDNQINLDKSMYPYSGAVRAQCALVAGMVLWEKKIIAKAAEKHFNFDIKQINHYGTFSWRNIRGSSRRSQHSSANAIDISGFTLENGRTISVQNHWNNDQAEAHFLRDIRDGSCRIFSGVLGPDYNKIHADHFHFDLGPYNICR